MVPDIPPSTQEKVQPFSGEWWRSFLGGVADRLARRRTVEILTQSDAASPSAGSAVPAELPPSTKEPHETRRSPTDVVRRIVGLPPDNTAICLPETMKITDLFVKKNEIGGAFLMHFTTKDGLVVYALIQRAEVERRMMHHVSYYAVTPMDETVVAFVNTMLLPIDKDVQGTGLRKRVVGGLVLPQ